MITIFYRLPATGELQHPRVQVACVQHYPQAAALLALLAACGVPAAAAPCRRLGTVKALVRARDRQAAAAATLKWPATAQRHA